MSTIVQQHVSLALPPARAARDVKPRPNVLRALGPCDPPSSVEIDGEDFERTEIVKHDSWAATAFYQSRQGRRIVCKFHRRHSIFGLPMAWLGRALARHERTLYLRLSGIENIPAELGPVFVVGEQQRNAVAHEFVPGHPLSDDEQQEPRFFDELEKLLRQIHARGVAYVDTHKCENILVGDDGRPHLFDFQISFALPRGWWVRCTPLPWLLRTLQRTDEFCLLKHRVVRCRSSGLKWSEMEKHRPWWIRAHRFVAEPLRNARRRLLVLIGVRKRGGKAESEAAPEVAFRKMAA
jgi:hypothetical protein